MMLKDTVACVVNDQGNRVSQWYSRVGDAVRKQKQMSGWYGNITQYQVFYADNLELKVYTAKELNEQR